jgi:hypothetical protein
VANSAEQIAADAAKGFNVLECEACARNIQKALQNEGQKAQMIEIRGGGARGFIVSRSFDGGRTAIAQNGRHLGVRVGEVVFDNLHPDGLLFDEWIKDFDAIGGVSLHSVTDF